MRLNRTSGNLRGEEEIYFQVDTSGLKAGAGYVRTLTFTGESGSSDSVVIQFSTSDGPLHVPVS